MPHINYNQLPNFFIIGAAKCGTTSLAHGLMQHPSIYIPKLKEIAYFNEEHHFSQEVNYLTSFFRGHEKNPLRGDASPQYLFCERVPARVKQLYNERPLKLIVILRDPFKRAISSYKQACVRGDECLDFAEAVNEEKLWRLDIQSKSKHCRTLGAYIGAGFYYKQLQRWLNYFPRESFLILLTDELTANPQKTFQRIFSFLDVNAPAEFDYSRRANMATIPRSRFINYLVRGSEPIRRIARNCLSQQARFKIKQSIDKLNMCEQKKCIEISIETKNEICNFFREDVKQLENLINKKLSHWLQ